MHISILEFVVAVKNDTTLCTVVVAGAFGKFHGGMPLTSSSYPEKSAEAHMFSENRGDEISTAISAGKVLQNSIMLVDTIFVVLNYHIFL